MLQSIQIDPNYNVELCMDDTNYYEHDDAWSLHLNKAMNEMLSGSPTMDPDQNSYPFGVWEHLFECQRLNAVNQPMYQLTPAGKSYVQQLLDSGNDTKRMAAMCLLAYLAGISAHTYYNALTPCFTPADTIKTDDLSSKYPEMFDKPDAL